MPRFYFDLSNGVPMLDEDGIELPSVEAAREELRRTLPAVLRDEHGNQDEARVVSTVRDDRGRAVLVARLSFQIETAEDSGGLSDARRIAID